MSKVASEVINRLFVQYIAEKNGMSVEEAQAHVADGTYPRAPKKAKKKRVKSSQPKSKKKPLTTAQRIARRFGPEGGHRGGSPMVQGGAPGLGKRS